METAAPPLSPSGPALTGEELTRASRSRVEKGRLANRPRIVFAAVAWTFVAGACLTAAFLDAGPPFSLPLALLFVLLYAVVSRVQFEIGTGAAIPTEIVLVPMLFALPVRVVPAIVACGFLAKAVSASGHHLTLDRVHVLLTSATHSVGPVLVLAFAGGLPLRWSAWPVYVLALLAQFAADFVAAYLTSGLGHGVPLRKLAGFLRWVFMVDACLVPVGLAIAFAIRGEPWLAVLVLPPAFLLRHFSFERQRRIDHALELSDAYRGTAFLLGDVVEADDSYTGAHSRHVVDLVLAVCDELHVTPEERRDAEFVALLHDIGKLRIPSEIINKPGPLDGDERALIETHTIEGEVLLERVGGHLGHVGRIVRSCHEHWDGCGYPDGLAGESIPLVARIVMTCDAFSAMTTNRSYRAARTIEEAHAELRRCAGSQFEPRIVEAVFAVTAVA